MFLRVDKSRLSRKGSIFVAEVGDEKLVIGRTAGTSKVSAILAIAADLITKDRLPAIRIVKFKKVKDIYKSEALLHSYLNEFLDLSGDFYTVDDKVLAKYWKEV